MWVIPFAQVIFDADPIPLYKGDRKNKLDHAVLRLIFFGFLFENFY